MNLVRILYSCIFTSVQAEFFLLPDPTFLEAFDLKFHMLGHFFLYKVVYAYPSGPLARLHKNRSKASRKVGAEKRKTSACTLLLTVMRCSWRCSCWRCCCCWRCRLLSPTPRQKTRSDLKSRD